MRPPLKGIVVAGLGPVSSLGIGISAFAASAWEAKKRVTEKSGNAYRQIEGFNVHDYVNLKTQCLDRASGMALAASALAIEDAGWSEHPCDPTRVGLVLGTAHGNASVMEIYRDLNTPSPLRFVHTFINTPGGLTCQVLKLRGVHSVLCSGPLASLQAIRYACHLLVSNKADRILCGGVDSLRSYPYPPDPAVPERNRVTGEGAGMIALQRGKEATGRYYAELAGIGVECGSMPEPSLFKEALRRALHSNGISAQDLGAVVLATDPSGQYADIERTALLDFGIDDDRWVEFAAMTGDTAAAHGGLSAIVASVLLRNTSDYKYIAVNGFHNNQCIIMLFRGADYEYAR